MNKKRAGFEGQKAIVLPRKIIAMHCVQNPLICGSFITDIGYYPKARYHYCKRIKGIDQNILIYNLEGKGWAEIGNEKYTIGPGDFFIAPAGKYNCYASDEESPWTIYWIHFKGDTANAFVNAYLKKNASYKGTISFNSERLRIFEEIYKYLERGYGYDSLSYANMYLMRFLSTFLYNDAFNEGISTEIKFDVVNTSILFMQKNMHRTIDLKEIAAHVNISTSRYAAVFKKKTGFSPIEYFNHLKIQKACQYLQFTDMRVKEIAFDFGMEDPYYFSRLFTKVMSMPPKEYKSKFVHK